MTLLSAVLLVLCTCFAAVSTQDCADRNPMQVSSSSLVIQFFLDIRNRLTGDCKTIDAKYGMMRLEAFLYALDLVNSNKTLLYGKKIMALVLDTCKNPNRQLICNVGGSSAIALIGPESSNAAQIGSVIYSSFVPKTLLVTYGGTSEYLDDKQYFSNLFHTVPGDATMADALTDIAASFNWRYIAVIHSHSSLGDGMAKFQKLAAAKGLCIRYSFAVSGIATHKSLARILQPLKNEKRLQVLFVLLKDVDAKVLFAYIQTQYESFRHVNFVGGTRMGTKLDIFPQNSSVRLGVLTLQVESPLVKDFERYYLNLNVKNNTRNIYFKSFWEETFNCSVNKNITNGRKVCTGHEKLKEGTGFYSNASVAPIMYAVSAVSHGLRAALDMRCSSLTGINRTNCLQANLTSDDIGTAPYINDNIIKSLPSVRFKQLNDKEKELTFDSNFRLRLNYSVYTTQIHNGVLTYQNIGVWVNRNITVPLSHAFKQRLSINVSKIVWREGGLPIAKCSNECVAGQTKAVDRHLPCCWTCNTCTKNSIISNNTCKSCSLGSLPNEARSKCVAFSSFQIRMSYPFSVALVALSICAIIATCVVFFIFVRNYNSRLIKAGNRELSLVIQFGLLVIFITSIIFLISPSTVVCNIQQAIFGAGFVLCSAPLLLKTMTLFRIVHKASTSVATPRLVKGRSQLLICSGLVSIQFLLGALWLQGNPAKVQRYISTSKSRITIHCKFDLFSLAINFSYPAILMLLATVFALRIRRMKVPVECNESRCIASSMALTCLVLFVYLISFSIFSNNKDTFVQEYSISVVYLLVGIINIIGLFVPRIISLYFPSQDLKENLTRTSTILSNDAYAVAHSTPVNSIRRFKVSNNETQEVPSPLGRRHVSFSNRTAKVSPGITRSSRVSTVN